MIHNYFTLKEKQYKISDFLINNQNPSVIDLSIKKKVCKLNEYQHFSLFCDFFISKPLNLISKEELDHFTVALKKTHNEVDEYYPRSNFNTSDSNKEYFLVFNCKKGIFNLVNYYLNTKEYPKQTLITKLLFLKEKILFNFIEPLTIINLNIEIYVFNKDNINNDNYIFLEDLVDELKDIEEKYLNCIDGFNNDFHIIIKNINNEIVETYIYSLNDGNPNVNDVRSNLNNLLLNKVIVSYDKQRNKLMFKRTLPVSSQNYTMHLKILNCEDFLGFYKSDRNSEILLPYYENVSVVTWLIYWVTKLS